MTTVITPAYAQNDNPSFNHSMVFDWCHNPKAGSGIDRWCSGSEFEVTSVITAEENTPKENDMTTTRILYIIVIIICVELAYTSMHSPSKMDDPNVIGVFSFICAVYCIWKLSETFTNQRSTNQSN